MGSSMQDAGHNTIVQLDYRDPTGKILGAALMLYLTYINKMGILFMLIDIKYPPFSVEMFMSTSYDFNFRKVGRYVRR